MVCKPTIRRSAMLAIVFCVQLGCASQTVLAQNARPFQDLWIPPTIHGKSVDLTPLSAEPKFRVSKVTRAELLAAIKDITLAESTLDYKHERGAK